MQQVSFSNLLQVATLITNPVVVDLVKGALGVITGQLVGNAPLQITEGDHPKLTDIERRITTGLTKRDGKIAVVLLVEKPESLAERKAEHLSNLGGSGVIHLVTGVAFSSSKLDQPSTTRFVPSAGASVGHIRGSPGTIGCLARTKAGKKEITILTSAGHVLSMMNRAEKGDPIILPGHPDGPRNLKHKLATLDDFSFLNHHTEDTSWENILNHEDIATAKLDNIDDWPEYTMVPDPKESNRTKKVTSVVLREQLLDFVGTKVFKVGRTTGLTVGTFEVVGIEQYPIRLPDGRIYMYRDMIAIQSSEQGPFSLPGDSGALVYTEDFRALGFVVAGSENFTFACSAEQSLASVDARLVGSDA